MHLNVGFTKSLLQWDQLYTVLAAILVHSNSVSVGMSQGFSAILLPQLASPKSPILVDKSQASWIASLGVISTPFGALVSGFLSEIIGRKSTIRVTNLPFIVGWTLIALSSDIVTLCVGRFITGFATGMASACYVYVAEVSLPSQRGFLAALGPVFVSLGVLFVYYFGYLLDWRFLSTVCAGLSLASFTVLHLIPESPVWSASKGKFKQASDTLLRLRGSKAASETELSKIMASIDSIDSLSPQQYMHQCIEPSVWKPFLILITFFLFQEFSGMYILLYYSTNFFQEIGTEMDSSVESIIVGVVRLCMSAVGSICIQLCGRRSMAMLSSFGMGLTMVVVAGYGSLFESLQPTMRPFPYLPLICILFNVCFSMLGLLQLPWLMIGELYPLSVRGFMSGITSSLAYLFIFTIVKLYPDLLAALSMTGMMYLFSGSSFLAVVFVYYFLPETNGKLLTEIESLFKKSKCNDNKLADNGDNDCGTKPVNPLFVISR